MYEHARAREEQDWRRRRRRRRLVAKATILLNLSSCVRSVGDTADAYACIRAYLSKQAGSMFLTFCRVIFRWM